MKGVEQQLRAALSRHDLHKTIDEIEDSAYVVMVVMRRNEDGDDFAMATTTFGGTVTQYVGLLELG